ncbi:MAG: hypothetical protein E7219_01690 [Clostridiales bacterium]|nr:hypothetical protein [Clostridiales bacterium]
MLIHLLLKVRNNTFTDVKSVIIADFAGTLRDYRGPEELSNIKYNDIHLSDSGHILAYHTIYDALIGHYPEYSCDEGPDVIQTRSRKTREERLSSRNTGVSSISSAHGSDPAEVELNMRLDPAKSPSPETITLGEIADFVEKHR